MAGAVGRVILSGGAVGMTAIALGIATPTIKEFEGRRLAPYLDVVKVLTVCDGITGKKVIPGKTYTNAECDAMTTEEAAKFAQGVLQCSPHLEWHPYVLASMISFSYNVGVPTYCKSSIKRYFDQGKMVEACKFLPQYKYAGGRVFQGLVNRRQAEMNICLSTLTPGGLKYVLK